MSKKHFSWLLAVTLIAALLVLMMPEKTGQESGRESTGLLPGLAALANELDYVRIRAAGDEVVVTLERREGVWTVLESRSYPADLERLGTLISDLSQAEIVEQKTSNPELYPRLGVEDVATAEASGVQLEFAESSGLPSVIVGNVASGREGQYVRLADTAASVLIDRGLDVPTDPAQWLNRDVIDISRDEVVEVTVTHPDGEKVNARKTSADDENFELIDVPEGREPSSDWAINSLAGGLASLRLEAVEEDTAIDWTDAVEYTLLTADGMQANGWLVEREDGRWVRLGVSVYQAMGGELSADEEERSEFVEALTGRVNEINERVSGWAYRIPEYPFNAMTKRMDDLLKPVEES